ncbi:MAG TPA: glutaredoxin family protein [bacterium]|nr:glutaredoxin family protein [bacterium]
MFCRKVEEFLAGHGIPYQTKNVAEDPAAMAALERLGVATTPVTVIDGEVVVGFDRNRLTALLGLTTHGGGMKSGE